MSKPRQRPADDILKDLARLDEAYRKQHAAYQAFVESIQSQEPRAKAEAWMSYTSENIDTYGDQEALVYLRSRGHKCRAQIDELVSNWMRAARHSIAECAKGICTVTLETGRTKRTVGKALERTLEALEVSQHDDLHPWRVLRQWGPKGDRDWSSVDHLPYACSVVFSNWRLRPEQRGKPLVHQAAQTILKTQDEAGAWPCWADMKTPSVAATAMCVHALAAARPRGWKRAAEKAADHLWRKQERSGCWLDRRSPDPVYLSVLVLDAIDLSEGREPCTFGRLAKHRRGPETGGHRRFAVALSFPGELRGIVDPVAQELKGAFGSDRVLYDRFHEAELARPNLDVYLQKLYHEQSDLIVVFLCADYAKKEWCGIEWRAVRDLIKTRRHGDVMLLRTDSGSVPGIFSIDGYVDVAGRSASEIAGLIKARHEMERSQAPTNGSTRRRTRRA